MSTPISVSPLTPSTITTSGDYAITFDTLLGGTLNINGQPTSQITVNLASVAGGLVADTINITNANVSVGGAVGLSALANYQIGVNSRLSLQSTANLSVGTTFTFTGTNSQLAFGSGLNLPLLSGIKNFGAGNTIDVSAIATSASYSGNTLTLRDSNNNTVSTLTFSNGTYANGEFTLTPDGTGGTVVALGVGATNVTTSPSTATLKAGDTVRLTVSTALPITVSGGTPSLTLNNGGVATLNAAASTNGNLAFDYTVAAGQDTADLTVTGLLTNGATMVDANGVSLAGATVAVNPVGTLAIDTVAPVVNAVTTTPGSGTVTTGQTVTIDLAMSENVQVNGSSVTLALNDGGTATLLSGAGTNDLKFSYTVLPGQSTSDLAVTGVNLNGTAVTDLAGNTASLSGAITNPAGILAVNGSSSGGGGGGGGTGGGTTGTGTTIVDAVYRFFDTKLGTHFFTSDASEKAALTTPGLSTYRSDLTLETNNFGAVDTASTDTNKVQVYRFFDKTFGTHFFTSDASEMRSLSTPGAAGYRSDLVLETGGSFYEHATKEAGDVAVYRFFDTSHGTHFYTGDATEYAAITTPGNAGYRSDLVSEGISFYAPSGSYR